MKNITKMLLIIPLIIGLVNGFAFAKPITIKGSTTVLPIAQACAEAYMNENPDVDISVQGGGSGIGIASIIDGTADIGDASRAIKDKELDTAAANGVTPKAHVIAMDGIAVIVNPSNSIDAFTIREIKDIFTGKVSTWVDGTKIVVISRDSSSGTFEAFNSLALGTAKVRPDALMQASNKAVATTVANTPGAIGYVGLGYVTKDVKALTVDGIIAQKDTVLSGKYPLARPLFMYTNGSPKGTVKGFIDFVKSERGQKIAEENGYVGLR